MHQKLSFIANGNEERFVSVGQKQNIIGKYKRQAACSGENDCEKMKGNYHSSKVFITGKLVVVNMLCEHQGCPLQDWMIGAGWAVPPCLAARPTRSLGSKFSAADLIAICPAARGSHPRCRQKIHFPSPPSRTEERLFMKNTSVSRRSAFLMKQACWQQQQRAHIPGRSAVSSHTTVFDCGRWWGVGIGGGGGRHYTWI